MAQLPTKTQTLFADDIRPDSGGKVTLVGFLGGDNLIFPSNVNPPFVIPKMGFLTRLFDGDGNYDGAWTLLDPDNNVVSKSKDNFEVAKKSGEIHTVVTVTSVKVPKFGPFTYRLTLDGADYDFHIDIKRQ